MRKRILTALLVLFLINAVSQAAETDVFEIETEGSYQMEAGSSAELAKKVALFIAQRKAVALAGRYLSRKSLIKDYKLTKDEIYCLAAREIETEIIKEDWETVGKISAYRLRIRTKIQATDFIKAEIENIKQENKTSEESYQEEMEQPVTDRIDPGIEIAKAYRLLRKKRWRIAMIYLDHLEQKYPNWDSIYMAKAITHYLLQEPVFMKNALSEGCRLGNQTACSDLENIKKLHEHDFGLSVTK
jgi:hypothetical protein